MKEALIAFVVCLFIGAALNAMPGMSIALKPAETPAQVTPAGGPIPNTSDATFSSEVVGSPGVVVVDCYSDSCVPCKMFEPTVERVAAQFTGRAKFYRLDVDRNMTVRENYAVNTIPTLLIFKDGHKVDQYTGLMPEKDFQQAVSKLI